MTRQMILVDAEVIERLDRIEAMLAGLSAPQPQEMSIKDYADSMGVTPRTVDRWIERGQVTAKGAGKLRRVVVQPSLLAKSSGAVR